MTIEEFIIQKEIKHLQSRLDKLLKAGISIKTADIMVAKIESIKKHGLKINGGKQLLSEEYVNHELRKGSGGKQYYQINGTINYYPEARWGKYIKEVNVVKE